LDVRVKLDGYRAQAIKTLAKLQLRSRNNNDFSVRYSTIANALSKLPNETVVDGEIVALDQTGKPSFNALQNYNQRNPTFTSTFSICSSCPDAM
jgi:bifunctional non-homologous end joining protein LigD